MNFPVSVLFPYCVKWFLIKLAQATSKEDFERYDLIRCVVAADPKYPSIDLAKSLVDEMVENMALVQGLP
jgi:hypothetical protein